MMSEKRFGLIKETVLQYPISENGYQLSEYKVVQKLNALQEKLDKREEQISIIKNHCLKFLTDEQFETIRRALEDE